MKFKNFACCIVILFFVLVSNAFAEKTEEGQLPKAYFPENIFTFDKILEGNEVIHDFIIENKGNAVLNVEKVRTG